MPYVKDIGHSPTYVHNIISRSLPLMVHLDVPHERKGCTVFFEDAYEAHVIELERNATRALKRNSGILHYFLGEDAD